MIDFDKAFERLIGHEGGYVNDPADPGGETMYGITKRVAVEYGYTGPMKSLSLGQAKDIARKQYWDKVSANKFPGAIAFELFDMAYNHGVSRSAKILQAAVGVPDDGIIGPKTIAATQKLSTAAVLMLINAERIDFYTSLGTWASFGKGWARRVGANLRYGAQDL